MILTRKQEEGLKSQFNDTWIKNLILVLADTGTGKYPLVNFIISFFGYSRSNCLYRYSLWQRGPGAQVLKNKGCSRVHDASGSFISLSLVKMVLLYIFPYESLGPCNLLL